MSQKLQVLAGLLALLAFCGATKVYGTQFSSEPATSDKQIRQVSTCDEKQFIQESTELYDPCGTALRMSENSASIEKSGDELTGGISNKDSDEDRDLAGEINEIERAGFNTIQISPNNLVILSEEDELTKSDLEEIRQAEERAKVKIELLPNEEEGYVIESLNETSEMSTGEFSF